MREEPVVEPARLEEPLARHRHEHIQVLLVGEGVLGVHAGEAVAHARAGEVVLVWPRVEHEVPEAGRVALVQVLVPQATLEGTAGRLAPPPCGLDHLGTADPLWRGCIEALAEARQGPPVGRLAASRRRALLELVTIELAARLEAAGRTVPRSAYVDRALAFMAARLDDPPTLDEIAGAAGVGRRQLTRCFRAELGVAPVEHLTRARIEEAARRLVETEAPISTIALELGFKSLSHFNRTFRRQLGRAPTALRGVPAADALGDVEGGAAAPRSRT